MKTIMALTLLLNFALPAAAEVECLDSVYMKRLSDYLIGDDTPFGKWKYSSFMIKAKIELYIKAEDGTIWGRGNLRAFGIPYSPLEPVQLCIDKEAQRTFFGTVEYGLHEYYMKNKTLFVESDELEDKKFYKLSRRKAFYD